VSTYQCFSFLRYRKMSIAKLLMKVMNMRIVFGRNKCGRWVIWALAMHMATSVYENCFRPKQMWKVSDLGFSLACGYFSL